VSSPSDLKAARTARKTHIRELWKSTPSATAIAHVTGYTVGVVEACAREFGLRSPPRALGAGARGSYKQGTTARERIEKRRAAITAQWLITPSPIEVARQLDIPLRTVEVDAQDLGLRARAARHAISTEDLQERLNRKESIAEIARTYGVYQGAVHQLITERTVERPPKESQPLTHICTAADVQALITGNSSTAELCTRLKCTPLAFYRKAAKLGVRVRRRKSSVAESEMTAFVATFTDVEANTRELTSPFEIDCLVPSRAVAIDYNGEYWHGETGAKNKYNVRDKNNLCRQRQLRPIQIWASEWRHRRAAVEGILQTACNANTSIGARKLTLRVVPLKEAREFQEQYHIQGGIDSSIQLGLYEGGVLMQCMSFGAARFGAAANFELLRLVTRKGVSISGGAQRLFAEFRKNYPKATVLSYCDRRLFTGRVYETMGFTHVRDNAPGYAYFNLRDPKAKLESRQRYQKHKLPDLLESFDPAKTEWENMKEHSYTRVYDAGVAVYLFTPPEEPHQTSTAS
jgi:transposase-like protein